MLRREPVNRRVPIVIIASRNAEADALTEIEHGADDFLVKPFGHGELTARARAAIHRARTSRAGASVALTGPSSTPPIRHGDIQIDPSRRHVQVKDRPVKLTEQEFQLLYLLATNAGVVFSREGLLSEIWGSDRFVTVRSVDTLVSRLRRRIEPGEHDERRDISTPSAASGINLSTRARFDMKCERLRMARFAGAVALAASAALAAACGGSSDAATVTAPTGTVVTETFNGVVTSRRLIGEQLHRDGPRDPERHAIVDRPSDDDHHGVRNRQPGSTGGTCSFISGGTTQMPAGTTAQLSGTLPASGAYCVAVVDVGNAAGPITYTLTVAHT